MIGELFNGMVDEAVGKNDPVAARMRKHYNLSANVAGTKGFVGLFAAPAPSF